MVRGVKIEECLGGIPLIGWGSVKNALYAFAEGRAKASRATENHNINAYSQMNPMAGLLFAISNNQVSGNQFVDRMLEEAHPQVQGRGKWSRHYDYDGQGRFHKTSVEIEVLPEQADTYLLELNAAYVGKEVEVGLAEYLGIRRGLQWKSVGVQVDSRNGVAQFDFDRILERLKGVRGKLAKPSGGFFGRSSQPSTGKEIVEKIMGTDKHDSPKPTILGTVGQIEVALSLGRVGERYNWKHGDSGPDRYKAQGAVLTVPLATDYSDETKLVPATFSVQARRQSEKEYNRLPIVDERVKAKVDKLISEIQASFR